MECQRTTHPLRTLEERNTGRVAQTSARLVGSVSIAVKMVCGSYSNSTTIFLPSLGPEYLHPFSFSPFLLEWLVRECVWFGKIYMVRSM